MIPHSPNDSSDDDDHDVDSEFENQHDASTTSSPPSPTTDDTINNNTTTKNQTNDDQSSTTTTTIPNTLPPTIQSSSEQHVAPELFPYSFEYNHFQQFLFNAPPSSSSSSSSSLPLLSPFSSFLQQSSSHASPIALHSRLMHVIRVVEFTQMIHPLLHHYTNTHKNNDDQQTTEIAAMNHNMLQQVEEKSIVENDLFWLRYVSSNNNNKDNNGTHTSDKNQTTTNKDNGDDDDDSLKQLDYDQFLSRLNQEVNSIENQIMISVLAQRNNKLNNEDDDYTDDIDDDDKAMYEKWKSKRNFSASVTKQSKVEDLQHLIQLIGNLKELYVNQQMIMCGEGSCTHDGTMRIERVMRELIVDIDLHLGKNTERSNDETAAERTTAKNRKRIEKFGEQLFESFNYENRSSEEQHGQHDWLRQCVAPLNSGGNSVLHGDVEQMTRELCQMITPLSGVMPSYVISAFHSFIFALMRLFHSKINREEQTDNKLMRCVRLRSVDLVHVFTGYLMEFGDDEDDNESEYVREWHERTSWRPFGNVIPFTGGVDHQLLDKFPKMISILHGEVNWYIPGTLYDSTMNSEQLSKSVSKDQSYIEAQCSRAVKPINLQQPHRVVDFMDILSQIDTPRKTRKEQLRDETSIPLKKGEKKRKTAKKWKNLYGTKEELQVMLQRFIANEYCHMVMEEDSVMDELLMFHLNSIFSNNIYASTEKQHPLVLFTHSVRSLSKKLSDSTAINLSLLSDIQQIIPHIVGVVQTCIPNEPAHNSRKKTLLDVDDILSVSITLEQFFRSKERDRLSVKKLAPETEEHSLYSKFVEKSNKHVDKQIALIGAPKLNSSSSLEDCRLYLEQMIETCRKTADWNVHWRQTNLKSFEIQAHYNKNIRSNTIFNELAERVQSQRVDDNGFGSMTIKCLDLIYQQSYEINPSYLEPNTEVKKVTSKSKIIQKLISSWKTTQEPPEISNSSDNYSSTHLRKKRPNFKPENPYLFSYFKDILIRDKTSKAQPSHFGPLFDPFILENVNLKRPNNLLKYFKDEAPRLRKVLSDISGSQTKEFMISRLASIERLSQISTLKHQVSSLSRLVAQSTSSSNDEPNTSGVPNEDIYSSKIVTTLADIKTILTSRDHSRFTLRYKTTLADTASFLPTEREQKLFYYLMKIQYSGTKVPNLSYCSSVRNMVESLIDDLEMEPVLRDVTLIRHLVTILLCTKEFFIHGVRLSVAIIDSWNELSKTAAYELKTLVLTCLCLHALLQSKIFPFDSWPSLSDSLLQLSKSQVRTNVTFQADFARFVVYLMQNEQTSFETSTLVLLIPVLMLDIFDSIRISSLKIILSRLLNQPPANLWRTFSQYADCFVDQKSQLIMLFLLSKQMTAGQSLECLIDDLISSVMFNRRAVTFEHPRVNNNIGKLSYLSTMQLENISTSIPTFAIMPFEVVTLLKIVQLQIHLSETITINSSNFPFTPQDVFRSLLLTLDRLKALLKKLCPEESHAWTLMSSYVASTDDVLGYWYDNDTDHLISSWFSAASVDQTVNDALYTSFVICSSMLGFCKSYPITRYIAILEQIDHYIAHGIAEYVCLASLSTIQEQRKLAELVNVNYDPAIQAINEVCLQAFPAAASPRNSICSVVSTTIERCIPLLYAEDRERYTILTSQIDLALISFSPSHRELERNCNELLRLMSSNRSDPQLLKIILSVKRYARKKTSMTKLVPLFLKSLTHIPQLDINKLLSGSYLREDILQFTQIIFDSEYLHQNEASDMHDIKSQIICHLEDSPGAMFDRTLLTSITFTNIIDTLDTLRVQVASDGPPSLALEKLAILNTTLLPDVRPLVITDHRSSDFANRLLVELPSVWKTLQSIALNLPRNSQKFQQAINSLDNFLSEYMLPVEVLPHLECQYQAINLLMRNSSMKNNESYAMFNSIRLMHQIRKLKSIEPDIHTYFKLSRYYQALQHCVSILEGTNYSTDVESLLRQAIRLKKAMNRVRLCHQFTNELNQVKYLFQSFGDNTSDEFQYHPLINDIILSMRDKPDATPSPPNTQSVWNIIEYHPVIVHTVCKDEHSQSFHYLLYYKRLHGTLQSIEDDEDYYLLNFLYQQSLLGQTVKISWNAGSELSWFSDVVTSVHNMSTMKLLHRLLTNLSKNHDDCLHDLPQSNRITLLMFFEIAHISSSHPEELSVFSIYHHLTEGLKSFLLQNSSFYKLLTQMSDLICSTNYISKAMPVWILLHKFIRMYKEDERTSITMDSKGLKDELSKHTEIASQLKDVNQLMKQHIRYEKEKIYHESFVDVIQNLFRIPKKKFYSFARNLLHKKVTQNSSVLSQLILSLKQLRIVVLSQQFLRIDQKDTPAFIKYAHTLQILSYFSGPVEELYRWMIDFIDSDETLQYSEIFSLSPINKACILAGLKKNMSITAQESVTADGAGGDHQSQLTRFIQVLKSRGEWNTKILVQGSLLFACLELVDPAFASALGRLANKEEIIRKRNQLEASLKKLMLNEQIRNVFRITIENHNADWAQIDRMLWKSSLHSFVDVVTALPLLNSIKMMVQTRWATSINTCMVEFYRSEKKILHAIDAIHYTDDRLLPMKKRIASRLLNDEQLLIRVSKHMYNESPYSICLTQGADFTIAYQRDVDTWKTNFEALLYLYCQHDTEFTYSPNEALFLQTLDPNQEATNLIDMMMQDNKFRYEFVLPRNFILDSEQNTLNLASGTKPVNTSSLVEMIQKEENTDICSRPHELSNMKGIALLITMLRNIIHRSQFENFELVSACKRLLYGNSQNHFVGYNIALNLLEECSLLLYPTRSFLMHILTVISLVLVQSFVNLPEQEHTTFEIVYRGYVQLFSNMVMKIVRKNFELTNDLNDNDKKQLSSIFDWIANVSSHGKQSPAISEDVYQLLFVLFDFWSEQSTSRYSSSPLHDILYELQAFSCFLFRMDQNMEQKVQQLICFSFSDPEHCNLTRYKRTLVLTLILCDCDSSVQAFLTANLEESLSAYLYYASLRLSQTPSGVERLGIHWYTMIQSSLQNEFNLINLQYILSTLRTLAKHHDNTEFRKAQIETLGLLFVRLNQAKKQLCEQGLNFSLYSSFQEIIALRELFQTRSSTRFKTKNP